MGALGHRLSFRNSICRDTYWKKYGRAFQGFMDLGGFSTTSEKGPRSAFLGQFDPVMTLTCRIKTDI